MKDKNKKIMLAAVLSVIALAVGLITFFVWEDIVPLVTNLDAVREWAMQYGAWSYLLFGLLIVVQVVLAFIPGEPFEIAAGVLFGPVAGTLLCIVSAFAGSMLVFFAVRRVGVKIVEVFFPREKLDELRFLKSTKRRELIFAVVFVMPGTPKDLLSYFAGLTDINVHVWMLICSVGRIPSVVTSTLGGDFIAGNNYVSAAVVFGITLFISIAGILVYNRIKKVRTSADGEETE